MDSIYGRLIVRGRLPVASRIVNRPINCPYINKNFSAGVAPTQLKLAELENDSGDQRLMRPATMQEPPTVEYRSSYVSMDTEYIRSS